MTIAEAPKQVFDSISKWGSFLTPLGIILVLVFQAQFVSRKEFTDASEKMDGRVQKIELALVQLVEQNKVNDRQDMQIIDHEKRLRDLEHFHAQ
jgi:hypothetical protein